LDKTPKPFNEVNRSPDSFVRISSPGQDVNYQRASLVSSAKTTSKSVVSAARVSVDESIQSKKEDLKKNIEINLEKIINIQQFLENSLAAYEKMGPFREGASQRQLNDYETKFDRHI
jgi:hypothetical protein